jgi:hypothetical protein
MEIILILNMITSEQVKKFHAFHETEASSYLPSEPTACPRTEPRESSPKRKLCSDGADVVLQTFSSFISGFQLFYITRIQLLHG